jgi:Na+/H+ antiporter NhaD/arsenite permease-like protein
VGSLATLVGNPQNAYIGLASGITFTRYASVMAPVAAVCLLVTIGAAWLLYRKDLRQPLAPRTVTRKERAAAIEQPRLLTFGLAVVALVFVGFLFHDALGLPLSLIALTGGSLMIFFAPLFGRASPRVLFRRIDWSIILLFVGLFIVLRGVQTSGVLELLFGGLEAASAGAIRQVWGLGLVASIVSNLISNVPATLLLAPLVASFDSEALWFTLAASTTLAGNATLLGAAANLIVAEKAEELGVAVPFWSFAKVGLPVTVVTLATAFVMVRWLA